MAAFNRFFSNIHHNILSFNKHSPKSMAEPQQQQRPSYFRRLSSFIYGSAQSPASASSKTLPAQRVPCERTPLLGAALPGPQVSSNSNSIPHRPLSNTTVISRPNINRAATTAGPSHTSAATTSASIRPPVNRAITSTAALIGRPDAATLAAMESSSRPSMLSRAAQMISNHLELGEGTSYAHRNAPPAPSYWNEQAHPKYLIRLWDAVAEQATKSKYTVSTTARVVSTEKSMLHHFPELGKGDKVLTREFVEYVLGVALIHPFCTAENMGRWEILAASGGARGTWGPW